MPKRFRLLFLSSALLALSACGGDGDATGPRATPDGNLRYGDIAFKPCSLSTAGVDAVEAQCATLRVPENHDAPDGRQIDLAVALIPADGQAEPDPLVMIAGGPGQSALESYPQLHDAFGDARRNRSVLLVDARGTGGSHPLDCETEQARYEAMAPADLTPEAAAEYAESCRKELEADADLRFYTTTDHIRDLDLLRRKLGVERLNLVGVSYGTRVAQQFASRYPQHTRTLTLDSVVPNSLVLGQEHARNLEAALEQQFERCAADAACKTQLGDTRQQLAQVRETLRAGGLAPVRYRDPVSGQWREDIPDFGHLAMLLRLYAYQPQAAAMLPLIVRDAANGDYESLLAQSRAIYAQISGTMSAGMGMSVSCTEDPELAVAPEDADTVLGSEFVDFMLAQCKHWPKGERPAGFRKPLAGDVPVLAISGEFDPVTPPRYGDEVVEHLPNGRHLVLPGQGHSVLGIGCMPKLFAQFIETADAKALDAECLERLKPTPPFAGTYGWEP
ncbi:alpha/beta hydrolase [Luteimonas vadosa]|uniref:Alpha/beta hydrolase n=1 Tax=Luteimonas vadosa TaxID=1165507 RepID=A0ABP9DQB5_9GAMM